MGRPDNDALDDWGSRGREHQARRAEAGTVAGQAYAAHLEALPPAEASTEIRSMFCETETADLASAIASDLLLDPERADLIADEIRAARQRLEHATRPFRPTAAEG